MTSSEKGTDTKSGHVFKFRYVLMLGALLLFLLALLSHNRMDLAVLDGGVDEPLRNWIGPLGAHISRALLYLFGLATYPIALILIISAIRSFIRVPLERRGYIGSLVAVILGITILMAMWPQEFSSMTDSLGIGRKGVPELAFSGGVIGSQLAAPETDVMSAGLIRHYIGTIGAVIVACCLLLPGLFFVFMADWKPLIMSALTANGIGITFERRSRKEEDTAEEKEEEAKPPKKNPSPETDNAKPLPTEPVVQRPGEPELKESASPIPASKTSAGDDEDDDEDENYRPAPPAPLPGQIAGAALTAGIPIQRPSTELVRPEPVFSRSSAPDSIETPVSPVPSMRRFTDAKDVSEPGTKIQRPMSSLQNFAPNPDYVLPPISLLDKPKEVQMEDANHIEASKNSLQSTLESFGIEGHVSEIVVGPRVTLFEISIAQGISVKKVTQIQDNIAKDLKAESIRIMAPIPGKDTIGVEVPNKVSSMVFIRSLVESQIWKENRAEIPIILGRDVSGRVMVTDLAKAPHLLIAGSTGSGKSVCMNTLIMSLLFKFPPSDLRLILVDPKFVELEMYRPLPHLITPVVNDPKKVPLALRWGVNEMERRYKVLAKVKAKNLAVFNSRPLEQEPVLDENGDVIPPRLPLLIIIIDELADIMMTEAKGDVETSICRIAQKGRAAGIHLVIATQTPRKDIITGVIKANLPTKIAFKVVSGMDSRVILDTNGAEKLLGKGDMLFRPPGGSALERIQGSMVSDPEIQRVVDFVSGQVEQHFDTQVVAEAQVKTDDGEDSELGDDDNDIAGGLPAEFANSIAAKYLQPGDGDLVRKALEIILSEQKASTSYLQRRLGIGYNKSAEIMDLLEQRGIISAPLPGGQKREILVFDELERED